MTEHGGNYVSDGGGGMRQERATDRVRKRKKRKKREHYFFFFAVLNNLSADSQESIHPPTPSACEVVEVAKKQGQKSWRIGGIPTARVEGLHRRNFYPPPRPFQRIVVARVAADISRVSRNSRQ